MIATRKLRPPVKRHGGKAYIARRIIAYFPPHRTYVEPFVGGSSVLLNKVPAEREVAGDLDAGLINLWTCLAKRPEWLADELALLDYTEANFETAKTWLAAPFAPLRCAGYLVRNRFSRGGLGKTFAWSNRLRGGQPGDVNAWETIRSELPAIAARVKAVEFNCCDALQLIRSVDGPDTLFYLDPPYLHETRTVRDAYDHEMSRDQHVALLDCLLSCKGNVAISGYRSPLYDEALAGWRRVEWEIANHSSQTKMKARRIECLWMNY